MRSLGIHTTAKCIVKPLLQRKLICVWWYCTETKHLEMPENHGGYESLSSPPTKYDQAIELERPNRQIRRQNKDRLQVTQVVNIALQESE